MSELVCTTRSAAETLELGRALGRELLAGDVVALCGDLGSGKTVFVRGIAEGVGADPDEVRSPTFTLCHSYFGRLILHHFDLYRLEEQEELFQLGFDEYLDPEDAVTAVEWGDKFSMFMPNDALWVRFDMHGPQERQVSFHVGEGGRGERLLQRLRAAIVDRFSVDGVEAP